LRHQQRHLRALLLILLLGLAWIVVIWLGEIDAGVCVAAAAERKMVVGMQVVLVVLLGWIWRTCSPGALHLPAQMIQQCCR
jgi:hypothetical protein